MPLLSLYSFAPETSGTSEFQPSWRHFVVAPMAEHEPVDTGGGMISAVENRDRPLVKEDTAKAFRTTDPANAAIFPEA